jgi:hypothetical protein
MRKFTLPLAAAALMLGAMALEASAQQQRGAACIRSLSNATPIITQAACRGGTGYCGCGPGFISRCAPRCCRCVPC